MSALLALLNIPLFVISMLILVIPVWFAAQVVGAGRSEFLRVAMTQLIALVLMLPMFFISPIWGLLLAPVVYVMTTKHLLETSYLGAFVLLVLAAAFQVGMAKLFVAGASPV